jgi:hypothetical protein
VHLRARGGLLGRDLRRRTAKIRYRGGQLRLNRSTLAVLGNFL